MMLFGACPWSFKAHFLNFAVFELQPCHRSALLLILLVIFTWEFMRLLLFRGKCRLVPSLLPAASPTGVGQRSQLLMGL